MNKIMVILVMLLANLAGAEVTLVKVDKSERKLFLYDDNGLVEQFDVALGGQPEGHKQQEGDQKTPEGRYTLDYKKEDSSYYRAMHISYPNKQDSENAKTRGVSPGGLIMIHGQKNGFGWLAPIVQFFDWTNGCIALTNSDMDRFMELVAVGTPIDIVW